MTQPLDVLKTRAMNAKPGEFKVRLSSTCLFHHIHLKIPSRSCESIFYMFYLFVFHPVQNMMHLVTYTAKLGPMGFFKGYVPAFIRLAPQTVLTFVFLEQLRKHFGYLQPKWDVQCNDLLGLFACYLFTNDGRATNISKTLTTTTKGA